MDDKIATENVIDVDAHSDKIDNVVEVDAQAQGNVLDKEEDSAKRRRLTSDVWKDFDKVINQYGSESAKCKHYNKKLVSGSKSGTTHLRSHMHRCTKRNQ